MSTSTRKHAAKRPHSHRPKARPENDATGEAPERSEACGLRELDRVRRQQMIEQVAYALAEQRGFVEGREIFDWLLAEKQIDRVFEGGRFSCD